MVVVVVVVVDSFVVVVRERSGCCCCSSSSSSSSPSFFGWFLVEEWQAAHGAFLVAQQPRTDAFRVEFMWTIGMEWPRDFITILAGIETAKCCKHSHPSSSTPTLPQPHMHTCTATSCCESPASAPAEPNSKSCPDGIRGGAFFFFSFNTFSVAARAAVPPRQQQQQKKKKTLKSFLVYTTTIRSLLLLCHSRNTKNQLQGFLWCKELSSRFIPSASSTSGFTALAVLVVACLPWALASHNTLASLEQTIPAGLIRLPRKDEEEQHHHYEMVVGIVASHGAHIAIITVWIYHHQRTTTLFITIIIMRSTIPL